MLQRRIEHDIERLSRLRIASEKGAIDDQCHKAVNHRPASGSDFEMFKFRTLSSGTTFQTRRSRGDDRKHRTSNRYIWAPAVDLTVDRERGEAVH